MVACPACGKSVKQSSINGHLDSGCQDYIEIPASAITNTESSNTSTSSFFKTPGSKKASSIARQTPDQFENESTQITTNRSITPSPATPASLKRSFEEASFPGSADNADSRAPPKKARPSALQNAAPLAERMRPRTLDEVSGQSLVGSDGVLRGLIETDRVPSMILWGYAGTGKTTIARIIAHTVGSRFVEINSTSTGVGECKKLFAEAKSELSLTGRKTIIFCDEIHRFSKTQQDVFLGPVEAGVVTLIGATTENPSFKVQNALLSRCRVFTLERLSAGDVEDILRRAVNQEGQHYGLAETLVDEEMLKYLAAFAEGDARTALNLLELAMNLSNRTGSTKESIKKALTKSLVYDRAGDQHYDTISAFQKSIRGSNADAALYYLARMLQSGEDPVYIARRMVVIASEDVGLADNTLLPLAIAAHTAASVVGMPECRINLAHVTVALALAPKSTRAYRGLANANKVLKEPGVASLPIPIHLRNAPTKLMKEMGYGQDYKYNPSYVDGRVQQEYLPDQLKGNRFLEDRDLGTQVDTELGVDADEREELDLPG